MNNKPYISFVVTSRNDNHGGDMLKRMRIFTKGLIHQCNKFKLNAELVFVEWNPINGERLLKDILPLPQKNDYLSIRFIIVPNELHVTLKHAENIPLFQMIGKNVGIQRAKADYILCTNVDLLFSNDLVQFLSQKKLQENHVYRVNRCDIPKDINENISVDEQLNFSRKNIIQRLGKNNFYVELTATSSFLFKIPGYAILRSIPNKIKRILNRQTKEDEVNFIDTNACGDFTLMHKNNWKQIEGYVELEAYSIHIDSLAMYSAVASGVKQVVLPTKMCTYHISHDNGWELMDPIKKIYFDIKMPMLDWTTVFHVAKHLLTEKEALSLNKPTWGFSDKKFKEYIFEPGKEMIEIN